MHLPNILKVRPTHRHLGLAGLLKLGAGLVLLLYVPTLNGITQSLLLFGGFHIGGLIVLGLSAYLVWVRKPDAVQQAPRLAWLPAATGSCMNAAAPPARP